MAKEQDITKINSNQLSSEEREKYIVQTENVPDTENSPIELENEPSAITGGDKESFMVEVELEGEQPEQKTEPIKETPAPEPVKPAPSADEELYNSIIAKVPGLSKLGKNLAEISQAIEAPPRPSPEPTEGFLSQEDRDNLISEKTYEYLTSDSKALVLLNSAVKKSRELNQNDDSIPVITRMPATLEEWDNLSRISPMVSSQLISRANTIQKQVEQNLTEIETTFREAPKTNQQAGEKFVGNVEEYIKKLHPKITAEEGKDIATATESFFSKALNDGKYYTVKNGVKLLNSDMLFSDFLVQNSELMRKVAMLGASKANENEVRDLIKNKADGVSQTTLASKGGGVKKVRIDLNNPAVRENMSFEEREKFIEALDKEILNTKEL